MKMAVLGAGLMGRAIVFDLVNSPDVEQIGVADIDLSKAKQICHTVSSDKVSIHRMDAGNRTELVSFIRQYDVVINALFYTFNISVAKAAIEAGVHYVDLGGHIGHITDHILKLNEKARKAQVTLIPDLGVAPGMINILAGYGASRLDQVQSIKMYVGGIPLKPEPPLEYNHVFSMEGVLDHYTDPSLVIRNGAMMETPSLTGLETVYFERFGPLEAFHTAGGTSTIPISFPYLHTLEYKTIRYRGHAEKMKLLVDLNLTRKDYEIQVNGHKLKPREMLLKVLDPILSLKDKEDVVLLRVIVAGKEDEKERTYEYETVVYKNHLTQLTAMAQVTANTISIVAQMIGSGLIAKRGVYPPELHVPGKEYIKEMKERNIDIIESIY